MGQKKMLILIAGAIILAFLAGGFFPQAARHFEIAGKIFLNLLMMLVVPLVIFSMISGITGLGEISKIGRTGKNTILYYMATTALAVTTGLILVNIIGPGNGMETSAAAGAVRGAEKELGAVLEDVIIGNAAEGRQGLIASNIFRAMANMELLPLILFSLLFGSALSMSGEKAAPAVKLFSLMNEVMIKLTGWVMYLAPVGIFGIVSARIGRAGGFEKFLPELAAVGLYSLTVVSGLIIHSLVTLPLVLYAAARINPWKFMSGMGLALLNAFSTASSSATLPVTIESAEKNNGISARTAGFVLPLGATINMDGTAMYEAVAVMFIAQAYGIPMGLPEQIIIFLTATLAAIGAAGIPEAGLVTMVIVLKAVGLPLEGIGLLLAVDWFLDRCRTTVNVWGDAVGAGVVESLEKRT